MDECVSICEDWDGAMLEQVSDFHSLLDYGFSEGKDALVGLYLVILNFCVGFEGERCGERKEVLLLEIVLLISFAEGGIELSIQQHNPQSKITQFIL